LQDGRRGGRQRPRHRHQQAAALDRRQHQFEAFAEGFHFGTAELIDAAARHLAFDRIDDGARDVADEDRLEARMAAAEKRQRRQHTGERGEAVEEMIFRPKHDRRAEDDRAGDGLEDRRLSERLGTGIGRRRNLVGADRRDVDQAIDAGGACRFGDGAGAEDMDRIEALAPALAEDRNQIDDGVGVGDGTIDGPAIPEIGLHRLDPADHAERLEIAGEIGAADGGTHAPAALQ